MFPLASHPNSTKLAENDKNLTKISLVLNRIVTNPCFNKLMKEVKKLGIKCPRCRAELLYRCGRVSGAHQRYRCLMCGFQFVTEAKRFRIVQSPSCPVCGRKMHLYKRESDHFRFRCSFYPVCKTYAKLAKGEWPNGTFSPSCSRTTENQNAFCQE
jgi:transposase-like protein